MSYQYYEVFKVSISGTTTSTAGTTTIDKTYADASISDNADDADDAGNASKYASTADMETEDQKQNKRSRRSTAATAKSKGNAAGTTNQKAQSAVKFSSVDTKSCFNSDNEQNSVALNTQGLLSKTLFGDENGVPNLDPPALSAAGGPKTLGYEELLAAVELMTRTTTGAIADAFKELSQATQAVVNIMTDDRTKQLAENLKQADHRRAQNKIFGPLKIIFGFIIGIIAVVVSVLTSPISVALVMIALYGAVTLLTMDVGKFDKDSSMAGSATLLQVICIETAKAFTSGELDDKNEKIAKLVGTVLSIILAIAMIVVPIAGAAQSVKAANSIMNSISTAMKGSSRAAKIFAAAEKIAETRAIQLSAQIMLGASAGVMGSVQIANSVTEYNYGLSGVELEKIEGLLSFLQQSLKRYQAAMLNSTSQYAEDMALLKRIVEMGSQTMTQTANFS